MNGNIDQQPEVVNKETPDVQLAGILHQDAFTSDALTTINQTSNDLSRMGFNDSRSILDMGDRSTEAHLGKPVSDSENPTNAKANSDSSINSKSRTENRWDTWLKLQESTDNTHLPVPDDLGIPLPDSPELKGDAKVGPEIEFEDSFELPEQWKEAKPRPLGEYEELTPESKEVESVDSDYWTPERMKNATPTPFPKYEEPTPESDKNLERDKSDDPEDKDRKKPSEECFAKYEEEVESKTGRYFTDQDRYIEAVLNWCGE